jgi:Anti-sigma regulatory factor (Ser/Thr protein kinase)
LTISSHKGNLDVLREELKEVFFECGIRFQLYNKVFLSISEAVSNGIVHGNKLDIRKQIFIDFSYYDSVLEISVQDEGEGFDFSSVPDPTLEGNLKMESGRGIFLMRNCADRVLFDLNGSKVYIQFKTEE